MTAPVSRRLALRTQSRSAESTVPRDYSSLKVPESSNPQIHQKPHNNMQKVLNRATVEMIIFSVPKADALFLSESLHTMLIGS
jgi:hypothetical protein